MALRSVEYALLAAPGVLGLRVLPGHPWRWLVVVPLAALCGVLSEVLRQGRERGA